LEKRNTDSAEIIAERLDKAKQEFEYAPLFDVVIINDNLDKTKSEILITIKKFLEK
jgi:guanylate kinase